MAQYATIASFSLCTATSYAASSNDNLANAITITSLPFSHTISEAEAESNTSETGELACIGTLSWWYKITPTTSGNMTIVSGHSDNSLNCDIRLGVYTGTAHPLSQISCTDDDDGPYSLDPFGENETISVTAGTTYYIQTSVASIDSVDTGAVCKTDVTGTISVGGGGGAVPVSANFGVGAGLAISLGVLGGVAAGIRRRRQKKLQIKN